MNNISVIIPVYKNLDEFVCNLRNNLTYLKDSQIIIVNDDPSVTFPENLPAHQFNENQITWINNPNNVGFAPAVNIGCKAVQRDFIMLLNSDVKLYADTWRSSLEEFEKNPRLFAVSFAQREKDERIVGRNELYFKGGLFHHRSLPFNSALRTQHLELLSTAWAEGGSSIFRASMWMELGGMDEAYAPFYWEDIDISYRAKLRGWDIAFAPAIVVEHHHETTISRYFEDKVHDVAFRNQLYFTYKFARGWRRILFHIFKLKNYDMIRRMRMKV